MSDKQVEAERKRGDFFRDMLAELYGCPPLEVRPMCVYSACPFLDDDTGADFAECWDEVERARR